MANEKTVITVNLDMFDKDADAKTAEANKVAKTWASAMKHSPR